MAQGAIKAKKAGNAKASGGRSTVLGPKKGARTIAPRKQVLVKKQKMIKVRPPLCILYLVKYRRMIAIAYLRTKRVGGLLPSMGKLC